MAVGWRRSSPAAPEPVVAALEEDLGQRLPLPYRDFLLRQNGGEPEDNEFNVPRLDTDSGVNEFLSVAAIKNEFHGGDLPSGFVPVAFAEGGNLVLVRLTDGAVFFWDHELSGDERVVAIAEGFDEFFADLQPFDVSAMELKPGQVKSAWIDPDLLS